MRRLAGCAILAASGLVYAQDMPVPKMFRGLEH
jgi:hypothetical protein